MTNHVCRTCGRDIVRRLVGGMTTWGHATNPGPNHHYATPVTAPSPASQAGRPPAAISASGSPASAQRLAASSRQGVRPV